MVGIYILIVALMFGLREPKSLDQTDPDFIAMQGFFRNTPTTMIESHLLEGSFVDDVEKAFSAQITGMDTELLWQQAGVIRGDRLDAELVSAIEFLDIMIDSGYVEWFPSVEEIQRDSHYVYPINITMQGAGSGTTPESVRLIIMRPFDDMAFFAYVKI